jgi:hypothetical protein
MTRRIHCFVSVAVSVPDCLYLTARDNDKTGVRTRWGMAPQGVYRRIVTLTPSGYLFVCAVSPGTTTYLCNMAEPTGKGTSNYRWLT